MYAAVPSMTTFHSWLCALKMCSYLLCRTAYVLYSSHSYCIPGCSNCILHHSYMTVKLGQTRRQCEMRQMELECARDCRKVDMHANSCSYSPLSYIWRVDACIFLLFSISIRFILVCSCEILGRTD